MRNDRSAPSPGPAPGSEHSAPPQAPDLTRNQRTRWHSRPVPLWVAGTVAVVCLAVGGGAYAFSSAQVSAERSHVRDRDQTITSLRDQQTTLESKLSSTRSDLSDEKQTAATAVKAAQAKVDAADVQRKAGLDQREQQLDQQAADLDGQQKKIDQELQGMKASQFRDGIFQVGRDIQPGTYHTDGGSTCYWAKLNSSDTSNIADNDNSRGPITITINSAFFQSNDCGTWTKVG